MLIIHSKIGKILIKLNEKILINLILQILQLLFDYYLFFFFIISILVQQQNRIITSSQFIAHFQGFIDKNLVYYLISEIKQKMQIFSRSITPSLQKQNRRIRFSEESGQYYFITPQGKSCFINKIGQKCSKFVNNFTGFINFKQRKQIALSDPLLMYRQPKLKYKKQKGFKTYIGDKFKGYTQFPYQLSSLPQHLQQKMFQTNKKEKEKKQEMYKSKNKINNNQQIELTIKQNNKCKRNIMSAITRNKQKIIQIPINNRKIQRGSARNTVCNISQEQINRSSQFHHHYSRSSVQYIYQQQNIKNPLDYQSTIAESQNKSHSNLNTFYQKALISITTSQTKISHRQRCYKASCHYNYQPYQIKRRQKIPQTITINDHNEILQQQNKENQYNLKQIIRKNELIKIINRRNKRKF